MSLPPSKGVLFPGELPRFATYPVPEGAETLAVHVWIPEWSLPPGAVSRQTVLTFPAANLVCHPHAVTIAGPGRRAGTRELTGTGWAVGVLLRPAGVAALGVRPRTIVGREQDFPEPALGHAVRAAMRGPRPHADAVAAVAAWLGRLPAPPGEALEANDIVDAARTDPRLTTVAALADAVHLSPRTVQRRLADFVGLTPLAVIRRFRLHEAAARLRADARTPLARLAHEVGYADQAHFSRDFSAAIGVPPSAYRRAQGPATPSRRPEAPAS